VDGTAGDFLTDYKTIINELTAYGGALAEKPRITALNKIDALDAEEQSFFKAELEQISGGDVFLVSGVSGEGVSDVLRASRAVIDGAKAEPELTTDEEQDTWRP